MNFREEIDHFAQAMEYKLKRNDYKGGWEGLDVSAILERLKDEVDELKEAIEQGNRYEITMEAADIANFAMMIAWNKTGRFGRDDDKSRRDDSLLRREEMAHNKHVSATDRRRASMGGDDARMGDIEPYPTPKGPILDY